MAKVDYPIPRMIWAEQLICCRDLSEQAPIRYSTGNRHDTRADHAASSHQAFRQRADHGYLAGHHMFSGHAALVQTGFLGFRLIRTELPLLLNGSNRNQTSTEETCDVTNPLDAIDSNIFAYSYRHDLGRKASVGSSILTSPGTDEHDRDIAMESSSPLACSNSGTDLVEDMDGFQLDGDDSIRGKEYGPALSSRQQHAIRYLYSSKSGNPGPGIPVECIATSQDIDTSIIARGFINPTVGEK